MLAYVRDLLHTARLRARYRRLVQEQLLGLAEAHGAQPVAEDPGRWQLLGQSGQPLTDTDRADLRTRARRLVAENPHARNLLRLLEIYVVGPGLKLTHSECASEECDAASDERASNSTRDAFLPSAHHFQPSTLHQSADRLWRDFLTRNHRHYSFREHARRAWRDGESFLRLFPTRNWPPAVRFLDPEHVGPTSDDPDSQGILTEPHDVESPVAYLRIDPQSSDLLERIPAELLLHTRLNADSNQKRGITLFAPILDSLACFDRWIDTELTARRLQASIVLWRKVQGSPSQAAAFAESLQTSTGIDPSGPYRRERYRPGTILTTSHATDLQFLQPNTNFGDAVPLGRMLLLAIAAGGGVPEFMLTSDASNSNFASTMVAEGPAVKLFQSEQHFFADEFRQLWTWVMREAVRQGRLPPDIFDRVEPEWTFPQLVNRDRPRERLADARLLDAGVLSKAEVARRDGVDPQTMRNEIHDENGGRGPGTADPSLPA